MFLSSISKQQQLALWLKFISLFSIAPFQRRVAFHLVFGWLLIGFSPVAFAASCESVLAKMYGDEYDYWSGEMREATSCKCLDREGTTISSFTLFFSSWWGYIDHEQPFYAQSCLTDPNLCGDYSPNWSNGPKPDTTFYFLNTSGNDFYSCSTHGGGRFYTGKTVQQLPTPCWKKTNWNESNWMKVLDDSKRLHELAIPGTHDSGAYKTFEHGQTQDWDIKTQLENGIRFLDIRLAQLSSHGHFELKHGPLRLGGFKELVWEPVEDFLSDHPSETILMSVKEEKEYWEYFDPNDFESRYWYPSSSFYKGPVNISTTLGDVRGKIVLFNRYRAGKGISWNSSQLKIQDQYDLELVCVEVPIGFWSQRVCNPFDIDYPKKANIVKDFLNDARKQYFGSSPKFWINFASANYNGTFVDQNAKYVNPWVEGFFEEKLKAYVGSIVVMDYPNRTPGVIQSIIAHSVYHCH